jgi:hypothetical protein
VPLAGTVLFRGKPIAGAELVFHPLDDGPGWIPVSTSNPDGSFAASTRLPCDGVPPGRYRIAVVWRPVVDEDGEGTNRLPRRYASAKSSPLEVVAPMTSTQPIVLNIAE